MVSGKVNAVLVALLLVGFSAHAGTKKYLVTFKSQQAFQSTMMGMRSADSSGAIRLMGTSAKVAKTLRHVEMLVIETDDARALAALRQNPAVDIVEEEIMHPAPRRISTHGLNLDTSASPLPSFAMPWGIDAVRAPQAWSVTKGSGARVMVLDTGLDKRHIALTSRFEKGQNFSGGAADNISDDVGHGTHVSGTILADGANNGLSGVAPQATLLMGKVCTEFGCSSVGIASGIDWAVAEHVDVVNMSLGGMFISAGERQALDRAEANGVTVIAASGNDGTSSVSYPAAYATVLAVGAVDSTLARADFSQYGPELDIMGPGVDVISSVPLGTGRGGSAEVELPGKGLSQVNSMPLQGAPLFARRQKEVLPAGLGKPADFQGKNFSGKYALISRGEINFKEKVDNAIAAGAAGVLIYNNAPGLIQGGLTEDGSEVAIPATMIEQSVGQQMINAINTGATLQAAIAIEVTDYASFMGTSMATPHVAGVAALVKAANPRLTPAQVRDVLKSTAAALGSASEYGSGMVNAEAAVARARTM